MKEKVLIFQDFPDDVKEIVKSYNNNKYELIYWRQCDEKEQAIKTSKYFLITGTKIGEDIIKMSESLRLIQRIGVGLDNIDVEKTKEKGIFVCNTPGGNQHSVAEFTIASILNLYRKLTILDRTTKEGRWQKWDYRLSSFEMKGKTHGFIGMGGTGKETAAISRAFGTNIIYYSRTRLPEHVEGDFDAVYLGLDEVLKESDILSIHIPLTSHTVNLIGEKELSQMKKDAILINVSRGGIVDEKALYKAISNKSIGGAAIDTFVTEPVDKANPLLCFDNVIATPHIAGATKESLEFMIDISFKNFDLVEENKKPEYIVNDF